MMYFPKLVHKFYSVLAWRFSALLNRDSSEYIPLVVDIELTKQIMDNAIKNNKTAFDSEGNGHPTTMLIYYMNNEHNQFYKSELKIIFVPQCFPLHIIKSYQDTALKFTDKLNYMSGDMYKYYFDNGCTLSGSRKQLIVGIDYDGNAIFGSY